jgi:hypothetical protein
LSEHLLRGTPTTVFSCDNISEKINLKNDKSIADRQLVPSSYILQENDRFIAYRQRYSRNYGVAGALVLYYPSLLALVIAETIILLVLSSYILHSGITETMILLVFSSYILHSGITETMILLVLSSYILQAF